MRGPATQPPARPAATTGGGSSIRRLGLGLLVAAGLTATSAAVPAIAAAGPLSWPAPLPVSSGPAPRWSSTVSLETASRVAAQVDQPPCSIPNACPSNTSPPTVSGTAIQGRTLTEVSGTWTNSPTAFAYQWDDCNAAGEDCAPIAGATGQTHVLTTIDVGQTLRVEQTASNAAGASDSARSSQTGVVAPPPPSSVSPPAITGAPRQGQTLAVVSGTWTNSPTAFTYQWEDCDSSATACSPVAGATGQTYLLAATDVGQTIEVRQTATNAGGQSSPVSSAPTRPIQPPLPAPAPASPAAPPASPTPPVDQPAPVVSQTPAPTASAAPTREQIRNLLLSEITPTGQAAAITTILKSGGYTLPFRALTAGLAQVDWESVPPGSGPAHAGSGPAHAGSGPAHAAAAATTLLLASGSRSFTAPGTLKLRMTLTATGREFLRGEQSHVEFLTVSAKATFTPTAGLAPVTVTVKQAAGSPAATPPCFGAAAHDPHHPCENPSLRYAVSPTPDEALIIPNAPCSPLSLTGLLIPCLFGAPLGPATDEVALLGDSHAETWRAAMIVAADALHWSGVSLTRSSCPYSLATPVLGNPLTAGCVAWRSAVVAWLEANPRVGTVFVSDNDRASVVVPHGQTSLRTEVDGYLAAWRALPSTVTHIVVIRDPPFPGISTAPCVERAIARHDQAGPACALVRSSALTTDPEVIAAAEDAPRASVIDLSGFFCGPAACPPVIGGVLVYKDPSHMTDLYSTTLGPHLTAKIGRLLARWYANPEPG
jgi:hypothetical protein